MAQSDFMDFILLFAAVFATVVGGRGVFVGFSVFFSFIHSF